MSYILENHAATMHSMHMMSMLHGMILHVGKYYHKYYISVSQHDIV